jgi:hypothetical protein
MRSGSTFFNRSPQIFFDDYHQCPPIREDILRYFRTPHRLYEETETDPNPRTNQIDLSSINK